MNLLLYLTPHHMQLHREAECMPLDLCFRAVVTGMLEQVKCIMG